MIMSKSMTMVVIMIIILITIISIAMSIPCQVVTNMIGINIMFIYPYNLMIVIVL